MKKVTEEKTQLFLSRETRPKRDISSAYFHHFLSTRENPFLQDSLTCTQTQKRISVNLWRRKHCVFLFFALPSPSLSEVFFSCFERRRAVKTVVIVKLFCGLITSMNLPSRGAVKRVRVCIMAPSFSCFYYFCFFCLFVVNAFFCRPFLHRSFIFGLVAARNSDVGNRSQSDGLEVGIISASKENNHSTVRKHL